MSGKESYFVIEATADGITINAYSQQGLEDYLNDAKHGERMENWFQDYVQFLDALPSSDPNNWRSAKYGSMLIIKGEIVVPRPVEVVEKYKL